LLEGVDAVFVAEPMVLQVADDRVSGFLESSTVQGLLAVGVDRGVGGGNGFGDSLLDERSGTGFQRMGSRLKLSCLCFKLTIDSANLTEHCVTNVVRITVAGMRVEHHAPAAVVVKLAIGACDLGDVVDLVGKTSVELFTLAKLSGVRATSRGRRCSFAENNTRCFERAPDQADVLDLVVYDSLITFLRRSKLVEQPASAEAGVVTAIGACTLCDVDKLV
jgi:hypothetical protein